MTTPFFVAEYRYKRQNLLSAISQCKLWRTQWINHKKHYPDEVPYAEYILQHYREAFKLLCAAEQHLSVPILKEEHGKAFLKEMTFYKDNITN